MKPPNIKPKAHHQKIFLFLGLSLLAHMLFIYLIKNRPSTPWVFMPAPHTIIDIETIPALATLPSPLPELSDENLKPTSLEDLENLNILPSKFEKLQVARSEEIKKNIGKPIPNPVLTKKTAAAVASSATLSAPAAIPVAEASSVPLTSTALGIKALYPRLSRILAEEGVVTISVSANATGTKKITVLSSSGFLRLDRSAIEALKTNGSLHLKPNTQLKISFNFKLRKN